MYVQVNKIIGRQEWSVVADVQIVNVNKTFIKKVKVDCVNDGACSKLNDIIVQ